MIQTRDATERYQMGQASSRRQEMIQLVDVHKYYHMGEIRVEALDGVSLTIDQGEFVVILGPSGSGKTTLLNVIGALDTPTGGEIWVDGTEISELGRGGQFRFRRETIGFIFQTFNLFPSLTALENVQFVLDVVGRKNGAGKLATAALESVGLKERVRHFPHQLSGGEQQRVAIARALAKEAPVLLADEPTGELDFRTGVQILYLLKQQASVGKTVVIVTHNREIARIADRVIELHDGQVASDGPPQGGPVPVSELMW
jgi:putative ABC transport system ATP-binding protein